MKFKRGDKVYLDFGKSSLQGPPKIIETYVTKVGRRWIYVAPDYRFDPMETFFEEVGYPEDVAGDIYSSKHVLVSKYLLDDLKVLMNQNSAELARRGKPAAIIEFATHLGLTVQPIDIYN